MNRLLLALNLSLALFLVYRLAATGEGAAAAERTAAVWSAADVAEVSRVYGLRAHKHVAGVTVDLGAALLEPESATGEPVDLGLRIEPEFGMTTYLRTQRRADLVFEGGLPPGRHYTVHLSRPLPAASGRTLQPGVLFAFTTPWVGLGSVVIDEDDQTSAPSLLASFDLSVDLPRLREHLLLRDAESGAPIAASVTAVPWGDSDVFRIAPADGALPDRVDVVVTAGLKPRGGDVATDADQVRRITMREPLLVTGARFDDGDVELSFNRSVDLPAAGMIELEPPLPFQVFRASSGLRIVGEFRPGEVLGVRLRQGFPGSGRSTLAEDERRSLLTPDRPEELDFARSGSVLSARAEPVLEVRTVNLDAFRVRAQRVYTNNVVRVLQTGDERTMAPAIVREFPVLASRNEESIQRIDLRDLLGDASPRGLYRISLWTHDRYWWRESRLVQLTDLGTTVRAADDAAAVQVVSIADGVPVPAAEVEVVSPTNQVLATAETDARGVAMLRWAAGAADRSAFLVHVRTADDEAFVDMRGCAVELADPTLGGRRYTGAEPEAWLWPTRGIVRPGERIETTVLVRDAAGRAVAGREIVVVFEQPNGRDWRRQRLTTPGSGLVTATFETSADVPSGTWRLRALASDDGPELGSAPVQVEAFVPYRLEAEVAALEPLRFGGTCAVRVTGRWLDGAPASGRRVELRVRLLPGQFKPPSAAGFTFWSGGDAPPPGELPPVVGVLGDDGTVELRLTLPADASQQTLTAHLMAEVMDPSGRVVRAAAQAAVLRPDLHLGVRTTSDGVELRAVAADGAPITTAVDAKVRLERRWYRGYYERLDGSRWRWVTRVQSEVLREWPVTLDGGAAALPVAFPESPGWLAVVATAGRVTTELPIGAVPDRPDRLRVEGPAEAVAPGAVAHVAVDAPAAGRGFVTLEGPTVIAADVVELQQGRNDVLVPVPADLLVPNLHVVVTLTRPAREVGPDAGPAWLVGGAALPLRRDEVACPVSLHVQAVVLPEADLSCEVLAPGATSAVVAVVDEGVLAVTSHRDPDPVGHFLARRRLLVDGADAFAALMEGSKYVPGTKTGGDGDDLGGALLVGSISPRIRPLALFTEVQLDGDGHGVARFTLPSYEGRVRVMAVAAGPVSVGGASQATVVRAPLGLLATAPRMVSPGDRFTVPVTLRNDTGSDGVVALRCLGAGGVELVDGGALAVPLRAGEGSTIDVAVRANEPTAAAVAPTLHVEAVLGGERRTIDLDVHVRALRLLDTEQVGVRLDVVQELRVPEDFAADGLSAVLEVDSAPDVHLRPALEELVRYPYGCVEQTTSRGFAVLACQSLLSRIYGGDAVPMDAAEFVQAAADRLAGMQSARGSFGWWPGARQEYEFGTVYAMDFLVAAREQGFRVPESVVRAGLERVRATAASSGDISLRIFACELESRAGAPARGLVEWLATQASTGEDRALIALTFQRLGEHEQAAAILREDAAEASEADERQQGGLLRSPLRSRALRFRAMLAVDPTDVRLPELAWGIQQELLRTARPTTQEAGQVLRALADYYRASHLRGEAVLRGSIDGRPLPAPVDGRVALSVRPGSVLALEAGGRGFALLTIRGMRPPRPVVGDGSLELRRVIVDPDTGAEVSEFHRGRVYEVRLEGRAGRPLQNLVFVDLLPGGFEAEAPPPGAGRAQGRGHREIDTDIRVERRDDRVLMFRPDSLVGEFRFSHLVRATFPGSYAAHPPKVEAMYDPGAEFTGGYSDGVEIHP